MKLDSRCFPEVLQIKRSNHLDLLNRSKATFKNASSLANRIRRFDFQMFIGLSHSKDKSRRGDTGSVRMGKSSEQIQLLSLWIGHEPLERSRPTW